MMAIGRLLARGLCVAMLAFAAAPVAASPWAEVGDARLRADIENLAAHGILDDMTTTWPLPWGQISARISERGDRPMPPFVRRSLERVRARLERETRIDRLELSATARLAGETALVRDFATTARKEYDASASAEYLFSTTALRLTVGGQGQVDGEDSDLVFDGSYIAQALGNWIVYGGTIDQWWGPGRISSLILSNNARPFPRIGIMRNADEPFETPWLSWLGPWHLNAFVGLLNDHRAVKNVILTGFRLAINPVPGFEFAAFRTTMLCGDGINCDLNSLQSVAFLGDDNVVAGDTKNVTNGIGGADATFTSTLGGVDYSLYGQFIGEDIARGFFADISFLAGASLWGAAGHAGGLWRLTVEHSDTRAKLNNINKGPNITYEHAVFRSGYRFIGRSLGFSLDGDSRLTSVVASLTDLRDVTYRLAYHRAQINHDGTTINGAFAVPLSADREDINIVEAGVTVPWRNTVFALEGRVRDDSPNSPGEKDFDAAVEVSWSVRF